MGTIAQKLTYLDGTKQALKESINNLGGDITSETTFREYAQELDNIYDNLPKTTGEDTSLSLTTIKGKMNTTLKGDTEQDGTPTPDTPIDIEVVTGTQEVKVENVNLLNIENATQTANGISVTFENGEIKITGTATNSTTTYFSSIVQEVANVKSGETYTYSLTSDKTNPKFRFFLGSETSSFAQEPTYQTLLVDNSTHPTRTKTMTASGTLKLMLYCVVTAGDTFDLTIKPQLEKGSVATTYTPHQEQTQIVSLGDIELCKIGNYQDYLYKSNDKWYKKEQIKKVVFNGSENWELDINYQRAYTAAISNLILKPSSNDEKLSGISDKLIIETFIEIYANKKQGLGCSTGGAVSVHINGVTDTNTTANQFKTWLASNNIALYYVLATPNDIEITDTNLITQLDNLEKLKSYNGVTNINCSGNLSAILSVSALKGE